MGRRLLTLGGGPSPGVCRRTAAPPHTRPAQAPPRPRLGLGLGTRAPPRPRLGLGLGSRPQLSPTMALQPPSSTRRAARSLLAPPSQADSPPKPPRPNVVHVMTAAVRACHSEMKAAPSSGMPAPTCALAQRGWSRGQAGQPAQAGRRTPAPQGAGTGTAQHASGCRGRLPAGRAGQRGMPPAHREGGGRHKGCLQRPGQVVDVDACIKHKTASEIGHKPAPPPGLAAECERGPAAAAARRTQLVPRVRPHDVLLAQHLRHPARQRLRQAPLHVDGGELPQLPLPRLGPLQQQRTPAAQA